MAESGQKDVGRNRPSRVHIEYTVDTGGAEKKVQLPFVMGVLADLSGKSKRERADLADRKFTNLSSQTFKDVMSSVAPRVAFPVENRLTGEGQLMVDLTFTSMDAFSPAAVAANVDGLKQMLDARNQLDNLLNLMDGKSGAEALLTKLVKDREFLAKLVGAAPPGVTS